MMARLPTIPLTIAGVLVEVESILEASPGEPGPVKTGPSRVYSVRWTEAINGLFPHLLGAVSIECGRILGTAILSGYQRERDGSCTISLKDCRGPGDPQHALPAAGAPANAERPSELELQLDFFFPGMKKGV